MKKLFLLFILILSCTISGFAQTKLADSLRTVLETTTKPIERFDMLNRMILEINSTGGLVDSTSAMEMLKVAQELDNDSLLAISYNWLGTYFYLNGGDYTTALEYYYKGIPFAEKVQDKRRISSLYFDLALVYFDLQENEQALEVTQLGKENLPDTAQPLYNFMLVQYQGNMAQYFLVKNQGDSAYFYSNKLSDTYNLLGWNPSFQFTSYSFLAAAYAQKQMPEMADTYYLKALNLLKLKASERPSDWLFFYNNYIPFLLAEKRIEEAKTQADTLLASGIQLKNNGLKLAGASWLRQVFDTLGQVDSAYYYSQVEAKINNLIFSTGNKNKIQNIAFKERMRSFEDAKKREDYQNKMVKYGLLAGLLVFLLVAFVLMRNNKQKQKANKVLEKTLTNLKSMQNQLIQSEKMASLGELTAGIAHEIQNPLNFVNNFSELSNELMDEMKEELATGNQQSAMEIASDIKQNLTKITHHGKRADAIVKGMLEHSKASKGAKEATDINALTDEYLRLSYHGMLAKDKSFNTNLKTDFDESLGKIDVIPQDIGRVLLNLFNNAFYACAERSLSEADDRRRAAPTLPDGLASQRKVDKAGRTNYKPTVSVSTLRVVSPFKLEGVGGGAVGINSKSHIEIRVTDNGDGIPDSIKDKIFQPFFTTKPTGQGTGLGLSLSYDIVKAHGGELAVETSENKGTTFSIKLPIESKS